MEILYSILILLGSLIVGYLFGSISSGIIISKKVFHDDVREHGSGNAGGTNVGRVYGKKYGFITILLDVLKTIIAVWLCYFVFKYTHVENIFNFPGLHDYAAACAGLGTILGHCYPVFEGFKGGKAVSCFGGFCWATSWVMAIFGFSLFLIILRISKKVSLSSIITSISIALFSLILMICPAWFTTFGIFYNSNYDINIYTHLIYSAVLLVFAIILVIRHKENIKRLIAGTEKTVSLFDKKSK